MTTSTLSRSTGILFFGKSGVGKTTIMNALSELQNLPVSPVITTRKKRADDPASYTYITPEEFLKKEQEFCYCNYDYKNHRGYGTVLKEGVNLVSIGSPYNTETPKNWIKVLITGDADTGLYIRNAETGEDIAGRQKANIELSAEFYDTMSFQKDMDIIYKNDFHILPEEHARNLWKRIEDQL